MKYILATILLGSVSLTPAARADDRADATFIVEQTVTSTIMRGALSSMRPVLISAIQNDLRTRNIAVNKPELFFDIVMDEFIDLFVEDLRQATIPVYLEAFNAEELADIAAFYATPSGAALVSRTPSLMQAGALMGQQIGQNIMPKIMPRVAQRLRDENVDVMGDPTLMQDLLKELDI